MTPEQKQRLEQIRERFERDSRVAEQWERQGSARPEYLTDIDFLLSRLKEQEAGPPVAVDNIPEHVEMGIVETLETPARIVKRWLIEARNGRALESILLKSDRELLERYIAQQATAMRSACVEKVRKVLRPYELEFRRKTNSATNIVDYVVMELESLSIEKL